MIHRFHRFAQIESGVVRRAPTQRICGNLRNLWIVLFCLFASGSDATAERQAPADRASGKDAPQPYDETVPNSTVKFAMRPVTVTSDAGEARVLWVAETETTWDAYDVFALRLDENADNVAAAGAEGPDAITRPTQPYAPADRGWGHGGFPVISVTHNAAAKYCEWLTEKTGRTYRLPTAAEWRAAAAAEQETAPPEERGWFAANAEETTHPVAKKRPNANGLYDTVGNVAEWCVGENGKPLVLGGSFLTPAAELDRAVRDGERQTREWTKGDPSFPPSKWWFRNAPFAGFRVVCEAPPR